MKSFALFSSVGLFFAGCILLVLPVGVFPSFYDVRYMGIAGVVGALAIILLPKTLRVPTNSPRAKEKNEAADLFRFLIAILLVSNAVGDLGLYQLYKYGFEFDKLIHATSSLITAAFLPIIFYKRFGIGLLSGLIMSFCIVVMLGVFWELYEYAVDLFFGTRIFGVYHLDINTDTKRDIIFNTLGALVGVMIAWFKMKKRHENA